MKVSERFIAQRIAVLVLGSDSPQIRKKRVDTLVTLLNFCPEIQKVIFAGGEDQSRAMRFYFNECFKDLSRPRRVFTEEFSTTTHEKVENCTPLLENAQVIVLADPQEIRIAEKLLKETSPYVFPFIIC